MIKTTNIITANQGANITDANAILTDVKAGKTFYSVATPKKTGTLPTVTLALGNNSYPGGYHIGDVLGLSHIDPNLASVNIKYLASILGIDGVDYVRDISDADAISGDIRRGKSAYATSGAKKSGTLGILEVQVGNGADDSAGYTGNYDNTNTNHPLGMWGGSTRNSAYLFRGINIPANAKIVAAKLMFTCATGRDTGGMGSTQIKGEDAAAPAAYGAIEDFTARTYLSSGVFYTIEQVWVLNVQYLSIDIATVVQALLTKYGAYVNGIMAFEELGGGTNDRYQIAYGYDGDPTKATKLLIYYVQEQA